MESTTIRGDNKFTYIAFFDLDKTLTGSISGRALARKAFSRGLLKGSNLVSALYYALMYRLKLADPVIVTEKMARWVKGVPENVFIKLCGDVYTEDTLPAIFKEAYDEVRMHRQNNALTVILSSSVAPVCKAVATHMGIDDILCSELEIKEGLLTGKPEGRLCYGEEKLVRLRDYCEKKNVPLSTAWYYGDALIDLPPLSIVGNPVCINPGKKLRKIAAEKRWRIYLWK
jgi:HAD superfamily hydrolase (TIGR01490 family)